MRIPSPRHAALVAFVLAALALPGLAQEPSGTPPPKVDLLEALGNRYPFPLSVDLPAGLLQERYSRQVVSPQGKTAYGFSMLLPKGGWKEVPTAVEDLRADGPFRILAALRDLDAQAQMYLTVDFCRVKSIVDPLEYLEQLAGNGGWLLLGRQLWLRQAGTTYERVPNVLAVLPVDPKSGERTVVRAAIVVEGERVFVAVLGVPESRYAANAEAMALAVLSFAAEEKTPASYAQPLRTVRMRKDAVIGKFEVGASWIVREDVVPEPDVAGVGLELPAGDGALVGAMGVFLYPKTSFRRMELADRVKAVQGFVGEAAGAKDWTWIERISFVASRGRGPRDGTVEVYRADLVPAAGAPVPKGLELRIALLSNDKYWVVAWLYTFAQRGDRAGHAVARRAFSTVMDTLELE